MPLHKGCSPKARSQNIAIERRAGRPWKQAVAIAYSVQREQGCRVPRAPGHAAGTTNRYYVVKNYSDFGGVSYGPAEYRTAAEAVETARKTPHASIDVMSDSGSVLRTLIFSPKHPVNKHTTAKLLERLERYPGQAAGDVSYPSAESYAAAVVGTLMSKGMTFSRACNLVDEHEGQVRQAHREGKRPAALARQIH